MPILEYACHACGNRFDKLTRSMSAPVPEVTCPSCGAADVQKLMSAFGVTGVERRTTPTFNVPASASRSSPFG